MTLTDIGNVAGETVLEAGSPRARGPVLAPLPAARPAAARPRAAQPVVALSDAAPDIGDALLAAIRQGLTPGDPVARLLAHWPAPPARAVPTAGRRPGTA